MICATTPRTVLLGTAKPMPRLPCWPVLPVEICELTPITSPRASSSGPPELPWFSAASVWMACSIWKLFGAVSGRSSALTIPAVTLRV